MFLFGLVVKLFIMETIEKINDYRPGFIPPEIAKTVTDCATGKTINATQLTELHEWAKIAVPRVFSFVKRRLPEIIDEHERELKEIAGNMTEFFDVIKLSGMKLGSIIDGGETFEDSPEFGRSFWDEYERRPPQRAQNARRP